MTEPSVRTVDWYIDRALIRSGAPSDRVLGERIGLAPNSLTNYRTKRGWPSDHVMIRLADLAGIDPDIALMDLNSWRAKEDTVRERYTRLAKMLEKVGAGFAITVIFIAGVLTAPHADALEQGANRLTPISQNCTLSDILRRVRRLIRRLTGRTVRHA